MDGTSRDRTLLDARGTEVHVTVWPAAEPRAVLHVVHGVGEHAGRYDAFARLLAAAGITAVADDHLGHGRTGLDQGAIGRDGHARDGRGRGEHGRGGLGRVGPGGLAAVLDQVAAVGALARAEHPGLPFAVLGHSWGSFLVQILLGAGRVPAPPLAAVVLTGTAWRVPGYLRTGRFNRRWDRAPGATGLEWLSRDPAVARAFRADPLTHERSVQQVLGLRHAARILGGVGRHVPDVPLLVAVGSEDPVGGPRAALPLVRAYRRAGVRDVTLRVYRGARHEVLNETDGERVREDVLRWLLHVLPG